MAYVILIPTSEEYHHAGLAPNLWWNDQDYKSFKRGALTDLQCFLLHHPNIEPKAAVKMYFHHVEDGMPTSSPLSPSSPISHTKTSAASLDANASDNKEAAAHCASAVMKQHSTHPSPIKTHHNQQQHASQDGEPSHESKAHIPTFPVLDAIASPPPPPSSAMPSAASVNSNQYSHHLSSTITTTSTSATTSVFTSTTDSRAPSQCLSANGPSGPHFQLSSSTSKGAMSSSMSCKVYETSSDTPTTKAHDMMGLISKVTSMVLGPMLQDD